MTEAEFLQFHAATAAPLRAYLARASGDEALADDVVQNAFVRFLRARERPHDPAAQRVYLFRIAANLLRDEYRRAASDERRTRTALAEGFIPRADDAHAAAGGSASGISTETRLDVRQAFDGAPARDRELLWLAYVVGMSHREIAAVLDVAEASVRVLLLRARRRLEAALRAHDIGPEDLR